MSTTLSVSAFGAKAQWNYQNVLPLVNTLNQGQVSYNHVFNNGTGVDKVQTIYMNQPTLAPNTPVTIALSSAGNLKDVFGNSLVFAKVKGIYIEHVTPSATGNVEVDGNFFTNGFLHEGSGKFVVPPSGVFFYCDPGASGITVTGTTQDSITFTNKDAAAVSLKIVIIGE